MAISLPKQPDGYQFEEAMAAAVRSIGYFIECRTILDHEGREVLELDVVASPSTTNFSTKILLDAKKQLAGFGDIFKLYGWRVFLNISKGCIVHGVEADAPTQSAFNEMCPRLEVFAEYFDIAKDVNLLTVPVLNGEAEEKLRNAIRAIGWYELIADRLCVRDFHEVKKKHVGHDIFQRVQKYRRACHLAFFEKDPLKRVEMLYDAFKNDPGISGAAVEWQAGQTKRDSEEIWEAVRDSKEFPWIQHVLCLETKARILIIKNGLEAAMLDAVNDGKMTSFWEKLKLANLPKAFQNGFEQLAASEHKHAIPYILQLYIELFGAFIIDDTDKKHLASLARKPVEAVDEALKLIDVFYPMKNSWHTTSKEIRMLKMIPAYLRGIGAFLRQSLRDSKNYTEIAPNMGWLIAKWHDATFRILEPELATKEEVPVRK